MLTPDVRARVRSYLRKVEEDMVRRGIVPVLVVGISNPFTSEEYKLYTAATEEGVADLVPEFLRRIADLMEKSPPDVEVVP